ncbi:MAG: ABC transporter ATP-binding protein [Actinomycetota bacterium]
MSILRAVGLGVSFKGLHALEDVSVEVHEDEIVGLIGPNGAGKSTCFNCLTGLLDPDTGTVLLGEEDVTALPPHERARLGMGRTFQTVQLFGGMTVEENVLVGSHNRVAHGIVADGLRLPSSRSGERIARAEVREILELLDLWEERDRPARTLPLGEQRKVELARSLAQHPRVLLLDEPLAGVSRQAKQGTVETLRRIRREFGVSLLVIEHDMRLIMAITDFVYVLNAGRLLAKGTPEEVRANREVIVAYLGEGGEDRSWPSAGSRGGSRAAAGGADPGPRRR